jgi:glycosyltransferase involved in cell wall biosynthesis
VVGTGPDWTRLAALAGPNVEFLGSVDEPALRDLYQRATALVLPAEEDFGIAPVESLACGRPVIAFGRGGAVETVTQDVTGILVDDATPAAFAEAMRAVQLRTFDPSQLAASAQAFSVPRFERDFAEVLERTVTAATPC